MDYARKYDFGFVTKRHAMGVDTFLIRQISIAFRRTYFAFLSWGRVWGGGESLGGNRGNNGKLQLEKMGKLFRQVVGHFPWLNFMKLSPFDLYLLAYARHPLKQNAGES